MRVIHHKADARAKSLQLRPRPRQTSSYKDFIVGRALTDIEIIQVERIRLCLGFKG
jgi:hypothetical protein